MLEVPVDSKFLAVLGQIAELRQSFNDARAQYMSDPSQLLIRDNRGEADFWRNRSMHDLKLGENPTPLWCASRFLNWKKHTQVAKDTLAQHKRHFVERYSALTNFVSEIEGRFGMNIPSSLSGDFFKDASFLEAAETARPSTIFDVQVIVVTGAVNNRARCDWAMHLWGRELPYGNLEFITDSAAQENEERLPLVPTTAGPSDYWESQMKWKPGVQRLLEKGIQNNARWFLVLDDDTFLFPRNLVRFYNNPIRANAWQNDTVTQYWGRHCYVHPVHPSRRRICGGAGWTFGRFFAQKLLAVFDQCDSYWKSGQNVWSDIILSDCLFDKLNVETTDAIEFNAHPHTSYLLNNMMSESPHGAGKIVTMHYIAKEFDEYKLQNLPQKMIHYFNLYWAFREGDDQQETHLKWSSRGN